MYLKNPHNLHFNEIKLKQQGNIGLQFLARGLSISHEICRISTEIWQISREIQRISWNLVDFMWNLADFMKSGRFHVKSARFQLKSGRFHVDFMKSLVIAPTLHSSNWRVFAKTLAFIILGGFHRWNLGELCWISQVKSTRFQGEIWWISWNPWS